MEKPHSHLPYGDEGTGFYSDNTKGCFDVIDNASSLVLEALTTVLQSTQVSSYISIADFGCCDGGTSSVLWKKIFESILKIHPDIHFWLHYEDQPTNDWKSLFLRTHGISVSSNSSVIALKNEFKNLSISACGTSFYESCFPPSSLHFIFSATAMHWLSSPPSVKFDDALHIITSKNLKAKEIMKEQAAKDFETNLFYRAKELIKGGKMVLVNLGVDDKNQYLGNSNNGTVNMFSLFFELWKELKDKGKITNEEFINTSFANYYRSEEEIRYAFREDSILTKSGLKLESINFQRVPCSYRETLANQISIGSDIQPEEYANWYVPTLRTWSNSTFLNGLSDNRSSSEKNCIVDEFFDLYKQRVIKDPLQHGMDYIHSYVCIEKVF